MVCVVVLSTARCASRASQPQRPQPPHAETHRADGLARCSLAVRLARRAGLGDRTPDGGGEWRRASGLVAHAMWGTDRVMVLLSCSGQQVGGRSRTGPATPHLHARRVLLGVAGVRQPWRTAGAGRRGSVLYCEQNTFTAGNAAQPVGQISSDPEQSEAVVVVAVVRPASPACVRKWRVSVVSPAQRRVRLGEARVPPKTRARRRWRWHAPWCCLHRAHGTCAYTYRVRCGALQRTLGLGRNFRAAATHSGATYGVYRRSRHHGGPSCQAQHHQEEEEQVPSRAERPQDHCAGAPPHPHASPCPREQNCPPA
jgi:hypothetical protein